MVGNLLRSEALLAVININLPLINLPLRHLMHRDLLLTMVLHCRAAPVLAAPPRLHYAPSEGSPLPSTL